MDRLLEQINDQRTRDFCRGFGIDWQISIAGIFVYKQQQGAQPEVDASWAMAQHLATACRFS
jgi:hypothetical protein